MNAVVINEVRRGFYLDSVALMRFSRTIADMVGIEEAALMMGTPANRQIMTEAGLLDSNGQLAESGDLIIGIRATSVEAGELAHAEVTNLLDQPTVVGGVGQTWRPRSIHAAVKVMPNASLALISVPGDYATAEARKALRHGLHVMIFSDNVSIEDESALKQEARDLGLLVMGPDCGTAILNGVSLAFSNKVPRGDIAIIGASGTGIQEVSCLIAQGGKGISQAIGVGGRDLKKEIGGISTLMALEALDNDPETRHIVIISKPPSPSIAAKIFERIGASNKTFTVCFIGADDWAIPKNAHLAKTLKEAAEDAIGEEQIFRDFDLATVAVSVPAERRQVCGLFSGGTLSAEAQTIFRAGGEMVTSNAPIPGVPDLQEANTRHKMIDLGSDEYTKGRPHPMIDPSVLDDALREALTDPLIGIVLVDIVIGFGAHADPAGHLVAQLNGLSKDSPLVIASVTGTEEDPQGRTVQMNKLSDAGVLVAPSNADAAALALACLRNDG